MRLDHIAYRVKDRTKTTKFFDDCFGYQCIGTWDLEYDDGSTTRFNMLVPPEKRPPKAEMWTHYGPREAVFLASPSLNLEANCEYHAPPEIAVSDGPLGSIVGDWVAKTNSGVGGIHHIAYAINNIDEVFDDWTNKGIEFLTDEVVDCPDDDLRQIFTKPQPLLGDVIIELIQRGNKGFCQNSVKKLIESTNETNDQ